MAITIGRGYWRSPPSLKVVWGPWEARAMHLERDGWEFQQILDRLDPWNDTVTLAMRHRQSGACAQLRGHGRAFGRLASEPWNDALADEALLVVESMSASAFQAMLTRPMRQAVWRPVSMEPSFVQEPFRFDRIFSDQQSEEIIVEPATVSALLEQIKQLQAPDLARIREENRRREARERVPEIRHATILSIAA